MIKFQEDEEPSLVQEEENEENEIILGP